MTRFKILDDMEESVRSFARKINELRLEEALTYRKKMKELEMTYTVLHNHYENENIYGTLPHVFHTQKDRHNYVEWACSARGGWHFESACGNTTWLGKRHPNVPVHKTKDCSMKYTVVLNHYENGAQRGTETAKRTLNFETLKEHEDYVDWACSYGGYHFESSCKNTTLLGKAVVNSFFKYDNSLGEAVTQCAREIVQKKLKTLEEYRPHIYQILKTTYASGRDEFTIRRKSQDQEQWSDLGTSPTYEKALSRLKIWKDSDLKAWKDSTKVGEYLMWEENSSYVDRRKDSTTCPG